MKKNTGAKCLLPFALITAIGWFDCSPTGGGTDVPSGYVAGRLYTEDGKAGRKTAVRFVKVVEPKTGKSRYGQEIPVHDLTLITNDKGEIVFDSQQLEDGVYSVLGEAGVLKSYTDSVVFRNGVCDSIFDTLRRPGSLTGTIKLHYGDDSRLTSVYLPGTKEFYFITDTSGMFTIDNLAEGTYRIRFDTKLPTYLPFDTFVTIRSGCNDTISSPINLQFLIQIQGFKVVYDTLMRSATFSWGKIDSNIIGGYNLEINNGFSQLSRVIRNDTSISLYLNDYIGGRLSTINVNNSVMQNYTDWVYFTAKDAFTVKSIALPVDSVRTKGWARINDQFYVIRSSMFNPREVSLCVHDKKGERLSIISLYNVVKDPLAVAAKGDTLYILEKKNEDTLCIRPLFSEDSLACPANLIIPNNSGAMANLAFASDGTVYVSQFLSTYILSGDGHIIDQVDNLASHFALSETGFYTNVNEPGLKASAKIVQFKLQDKKLMPTDTIIYDTYGFAADRPRIIAANNKGIVCCLVEQSVFVNYEYKEKEFHARLYFKNASEIVDLLLDDKNELYVLYVNGRIDVADFATRIDQFEESIDSPSIPAKLQ